jgi:hypothetical protein
VRTTLNLEPGALAMARSLARQRRTSLGKAASLLILNGGAGRRDPGKVFHGVKLAPKTGVPVTAEEVARSLYD